MASSSYYSSYTSGINTGDFYSLLGDRNSSYITSSSNYGRFYDSGDNYGSRYSSSTTYKSRYPEYSSSSLYSRNYLNDDYGSSKYSSSLSNSSSAYYGGGIGNTPAYDKFGKELSNYDRWKLSKGEGISSTSVLATLDNGFKNEDDDLDSAVATIRRNINNNKEKKLRRFSRHVMFQDENNENNIYDNNSTLKRATRARTVIGGEIDETDRLPFTTSLTLGSRYNSTSKSSNDNRIVTSFPSGAREKLAGYEVRDVIGDGGCYYRCLSLYFTGSQGDYNKYRREVMKYLKDNLDNYSSMIKSEVGYASTSDYFNRKTRTDRQEFAETTEIIATCVVYDINIHVLAVVPGRRNNWEWLHFDPSIGTGRPSTASRHIYLYNQGSVHFQLCTPKY